MAIFHLTTKSIRRQQRSSIASAAYRARERLYDERRQQWYDYSHRKSEIEARVILIPQADSTACVMQGPDWEAERAALWNAAEAAEKRADARTAREYEIALPAELPARQRLQLAARFGLALMERYGVAVDLSIHAPSRDGDRRNHHVHIQTTSRTVVADPAGSCTVAAFGEKVAPELSDDKRRGRGLPTASEEIGALRELWAEMANAALAAAGSDSRIDHRTLAEQGIDRFPTTHVGPAATALEREAVAVRRQVGTTDDVLDKPVTRRGRRHAETVAFNAAQVAAELAEAEDSAIDEAENDASPSPSLQPSATLDRAREQRGRQRRDREAAGSKRNRRRVRPLPIDPALEWILYSYDDLDPAELERWGRLSFSELNRTMRRLKSEVYPLTRRVSTATAVVRVQRSEPYRARAAASYAAERANAAWTVGAEAERQLRAFLQPRSLKGFTLLALAVTGIYVDPRIDKLATTRDVAWRQHQAALRAYGRHTERAVSALVETVAVEAEPVRADRDREAAQRRYEAVAAILRARASSRTRLGPQHQAAPKTAGRERPDMSLADVTAALSQAVGISHREIGLWIRMPIGRLRKISREARPPSAERMARESPAARAARVERDRALLGMQAASNRARAALTEHAELERLEAARDDVWHRYLAAVAAYVEHEARATEAARRERDVVAALTAQILTAQREAQRRHEVIETILKARQNDDPAGAIRRYTKEALGARQTDEAAEIDDSDDEVGAEIEPDDGVELG